MGAIERESFQGAYTLDSVLADTPVITYKNYAGGAVIIPSGSSITSLTYYGAGDYSGTFTAIYDSAGVAVTQTVAGGRAYPIPDACFPYPYLKIVSNADGAVTFVGKT